VIRRTIVAMHLLPAIGSRPLASISPSQIQRLVNAWAETQAPSTVVSSLDFLRLTVTIDRQRTRGAKGAMVSQDPKSRAGRRTLSRMDATRLAVLPLRNWAKMPNRSFFCRTGPRPGVHGPERRPRHHPLHHRPPGL
jgi:hypothetical protein